MIRVSRLTIIGQLRMLFDANLFLGVIIHIFAEITLGFDSFRSRVVRRSEFTGCRVPSLCSMFCNLFV